MVTPSKESPTLYVATNLDIALEAVLNKHETGLHEMEMKKQELQELLQQRRLSPSDEIATLLK
jgi:hypothetical protein